MNKVIVMIMCALMLTACASSKRLTQTIDQSTTIVISPPASLYNCPQIGKIPDPETLTNQQAAEFIEKLYKYHRVCKISLNKIEQYVKKAKAVHGS